MDEEEDGGKKTERRRQRKKIGCNVRFINHCYLCVISSILESSEMK
jgi:hypothetical protein